MALGAALAGPQNGGLPPLSLPAVSVSSQSKSVDTTKSSAPSITKKTEKKIVKAKKMRASSEYDLDLDERLSAPKEIKTFDRTAAAKETEEARQAAKAKSKAAAAEKQAALEARKQEAEARRNKLAEEKAEKEAARGAKLAEGKVSG